MVEGLLEIIMGSVYTTGGQVPRGPELFSLECENSPSTERGVYIYDGSVIYLTCHHKAKRSTNREFNVVRFLPVRARRVLYKCMVYIRPFVDMLRREEFHQSSSATLGLQRRFLFPSNRALNQPWDSSRLTAILKKSYG